MCGISGIVGNNIDKVELNRMISTLSHRGPDSNNKFTNKKKNVYLGHNRLSIIDLSNAGNQPMQNQKKKYCIGI